MSLNNFYPLRNTDKFDLGYIDAFYDRLFLPVKDSTANILEIGIYGGESILLWNDFFTNAKVYGIDVADCPNHNGLYDLSRNPNSKVRVFANVNAYSEFAIDRLKSIHPEGFDILIDDGPHTFESMVFYLNNYLPILKSKGILVLEDIIVREWTHELLKLIDPNIGKITVVDMRDKIKSPILKQRWAGGLDVIIVEKN